MIKVILRGTSDGVQPCAKSGRGWRKAEEIGQLLGVRPVPSRCVVLGEPPRPFKLPLSNDQFTASLYVGSTSYSFEARHRRGEAAFLGEAMFCVSFKKIDRIMFADEKVDAVSRALNVAVYRQGFVEDAVVANYLLHEPVRECLANVDFAVLSRFFLSPIQIEATARLKTPVACAEQIRIFLDLMNALDCARKPVPPSAATKRKPI